MNRPFLLTHSGASGEVSEATWGPMGEVGQVRCRWQNSIKPVPYTGRCPHIHIAISQNGRRIFTTQMLIKGHPQNERDGVYNQIRDPAARQGVLAEFKPLPESKIGELSVNFNVVMGLNPEDDHGPVRGGIGKSERGAGGGFGGPPGAGFGRRGGPPDGPPPEQ